MEMNDYRCNDDFYEPFKFCDEKSRFVRGNEFRAFKILQCNENIVSILVIM